MAISGNNEGFSLERGTQNGRTGTELERCIGKGRGGGGKIGNTGQLSKLIVSWLFTVKEFGNVSSFLNHTVVPGFNVAADENHNCGAVEDQVLSIARELSTFFQDAGEVAAGHGPKKHESLVAN